jgi:uncharacterized protein YggL (DUF469 family)
LHLGEFRELGFLVSFTFTANLPIETRNNLLHRFNDEVIEANNLCELGGGVGDVWEVLVRSNRTNVFVLVFRHSRIYLEKNTRQFQFMQNIGLTAHR